MKYSSEIKMLPVVSIADGEEIGIVEDFIIDPARRSIVAIVIKDKYWFKGPKAVAFSLIHSIGNFAITIENSSSVVELMEMDELVNLLEKKVEIVNSKVITKSGRMIGFIKEYTIDSKSGRILGLELKEDSQISDPSKNIIPADAIVTIGKDVIIAEDDVEARLIDKHDETLGFVTEEVNLPPKKKKTVLEAETPTISTEKPPKVEIEKTPVQEKEELEEISPPKVDIPKEEETAESGESLSEIFERRQIKYMMGKKVSKTLETDDGIVIAKKGDVINDDIIKKAKKAGKFLELSMSIEIED